MKIDEDTEPLVQLLVGDYLSEEVSREKQC